MLYIAASDKTKTDVQCCSTFLKMRHKTVWITGLNVAIDQSVNFAASNITLIMKPKQDKLIHL